MNHYCKGIIRPSDLLETHKAHFHTGAPWGQSTRGGDRQEAGQKKGGSGSQKVAYITGALVSLADAYSTWSKQTHLCPGIFVHFYVKPTSDTARVFFSCVHNRQIH